jgi:hypothetical protein
VCGLLYPRVGIVLEPSDQSSSFLGSHHTFVVGSLSHTLGVQQNICESLSYFAGLISANRSFAHVLLAFDCASALIKGPNMVPMTSSFPIAM